MPLNIPINGIQEPNTYSVVQDIIRRAIDGTTVPLFIDSRSNRITIGSTNGILNQFFVNVVSGFNANAIFYENIIGQKNACFGGDIVVSGHLSASTVRTRDVILNRATFTDGSQQTTAATASGGSSVVLVSTQSPSAASTITFSNLSPSTFYQVRLTLKQGTAAGFIRARFNADSGNNYNSSQMAVRNDGASAPTGNSAASFILVENEPNTGPQSGHQHLYTMDFNTLPTDNKTVGFYYTGRYTADTTTYWITSGAGSYVGASDLTSFSIVASAGDLTGTVSLYKYLTA